MIHFRLVVASLLLTLWSAEVFGQQTTISGFVRDAETAETMILANVVVRGTSIGTATNTSGYYNISGVPPGRHVVVASFIGYRDAVIEIELGAGQTLRLDIDLQPEGLAIDEVTVTADAIEEEEARSIGCTRLQTQVVRVLPTVFEPDVFRSLQFLPVVKAASDFSSGLYSRGGGPDQTLILLDRNTVYNPTHFFGFFSTFNPDAIKDVRLYKGNYPAEYGGRLGSVVDVYNKDGNRRSLDGTMSVGLLASRAMIEGPFSGGSYMLAVRRSTLEPLLAVLRNQDIDGIPNQFYFYDVNGKVNFDLSRDDRLSVAFYGGRDKLQLQLFDDATIDIAYGNQTLAVSWVHLFSPRLFSTFSLAGSRYFSEPVFELGGTEFSRENLVLDFSARGDLDFRATDIHRLRAGFFAGQFEFTLNEAFDQQESLAEQLPSTYASFYAEDLISLGSSIEVQVGLRGNYFGSSNDFRLEPRVNIEYRPNQLTRFQVGYGRYNQFLTLITSELFSGFDLWLTTGEGVPPAYGDQVGMGMKTTFSGGYNLDVEVYGRTMRQLFDLDPFIVDASGLPYRDLFRFGEGYAYGLELFADKTRGRFTGFVGYTFGVTRRRFADVNNGEYYAPKYDRTHDIDLVGFYRLSKSWRATAAFTLGTGQAYTEPLGHYATVDDPFVGGREVLVTRYNNRRLPVYHRLDLGLTRRAGFFGFAEYELQLQVINAYARENIWFYFFEFEEDGIKRNTIPQIPVPIPNISLTIDF